MGDADGFPFCISADTFFLIAAGHQDRIIYGCAQLNGAYDNACHEGQFLPCIIWDSHIDADGKLNDGYQNNRKGCRFKYDHDNNKNGCDRSNVDIADFSMTIWILLI